MPNARVVEMPDVKHWPHFEDAETFNADQPRASCCGLTCRANRDTDVLVVGAGPCGHDARQPARGVRHAAPS